MRIKDMFKTKSEIEEKYAEMKKEVSPVRMKLAAGETRYARARVGDIVLTSSRTLASQTAGIGTASCRLLLSISKSQTIMFCSISFISKTQKHPGNATYCQIKRELQLL